MSWEISLLLLLILFTLCLLFYICVACKSPGYSKQIPLSEFYVHLDKAIKEGRNIDYFCFYCRCLWSSSAVHCKTCEKCVEGFDHHCPFINNCVGQNNRKYFIIFIFFAFLYTTTAVINGGLSLYIAIEKFSFIDLEQNRQDRIKDIFVLIVVVLSIL